MFWLVMAALALNSRSSSSGFPVAAALALAAAFALSVLLHEAGHAGVVLLFGGSARVRLHAMGGETSHALKLSLPRQFAVTAAGPLAGFAAAGACYAACLALVARGGPAPALFGFLLAMVRINLLWSAVNLLPILPMDGGKLLALVLKARFGAGGLKFVYGLGILLGAALAVAALLSGNLFSAAIFGVFAAGGVNSWRLLSRRTPQDDDPALQRELQAAEALSDAGKPAEAVPLLLDLRRRTGRGRIFEVAAELLGHAYFKLGRRAEAIEALGSVEAELAYPSRVLLMGLACEAGDHERALRLGRALFPQKMDPHVAFISAAASAGARDREGALRWLKTALRTGLPDAAQRLQDPDFDFLRGDADFQELVRNCRR
jgi:Zn-dependent protease